MFQSQFDSPENIENGKCLLRLKNIRLEGVSKDSNHINLDLERGEIHGIMGESGAGKTGLARILAGLEIPQSGKIFLDSKFVEIKNSFDPFAFGMGVLYDNIHYTYIPHLTVKEYLYLWNERFLVSDKRLFEKTKKLLQVYEVNIQPNDLLFNLNTEECQLLALMKVLAKNPRIIVLDEPASRLSENKKNHLFRIIRKYAESQNGVLYLSNQLEEILQIGDRVTILKDGGTLAGFSIDFAKRNPEKVLSVYFGREMQDDDNEFKGLIDSMLHTTELLTSEYELQDLLNLLVEKITEATKANACSILMLDEKSTTVTECFQHSRSDLPRLDLKEEIVRNVIISGRPLIVNHIKEEELGEFFLQPVNVQSLACVPIRIRNKINGAMEIFYTSKKNITLEDVELLKTFATQVAIAVENTRLLGRSTLLKEAHHRIKNNLQSIISLLILQLQTESEKKLEAIVWQIIDRIKTIASVHEILSQDEREIGLINFANLVKLIIANYNQKTSFGQVETVVEVEDFYVSYRTATSLGLVVNELLANCLEHAFPGGRGGRIDLRLEQDQNFVYFQVADNGIGFDGTCSSGTLGLSLVKSLVNRDLRGSLKIVNHLGTQVTVTFPKKQMNN